MGMQPFKAWQRYVTVAFFTRATHLHPATWWPSSVPAVQVQPQYRWNHHKQCLTVLREVQVLQGKVGLQDVARKGWFSLFVLFSLSYCYYSDHCFS